MQYNNMLHEICNISTMKTATALSRFLKTPIKLDIKPIEIESIHNINLPNYSDKMAVGLFVPIKSKMVKGGSSLLLTQNSALAVCDLLLNRTEGSTKKITETEESALKELANIILGNFLTHFAHSLLVGTLLHSPAMFEKDTSPEIIKHTRSFLAKSLEHDKVINIAFGYEHANKKGDINIVLDSEEINHLLQELMVISNV